MKFNTDYQALAHHFMYNNDYSECYGNRMFSKNDTLYSYGHHFIMAKKLDNGVILINDKSCSATTAKQMRCLENAIGSNWTKFYVDSFTDHPSTIKMYFKKIRFYAEKLKKARSKADDYRWEVENYIQTIKSFKETLKVKYRFNKQEKQILEGGASPEVVALLNEAKAKAEKKAKALIRKRNRKQLEKLKTDIELWRNNEVSWLNNYYMTAPILRLTKDETEVETSYRSFVKVESAKRLFDMIKAKRDVKGHEIDNYTVISVNGTLKIGCHEIEMTEVISFAKQMGW
ncbi:MAG: hypothetical protein ACEPOW_13865 [Bacteroidales bacterium]